MADDRDRVFREVSATGTREFALVDSNCLVNTGIAPGRLSVPVLIQAATVAGQTTDYNTATWVARTYRALQLKIQQTAQTGSSGLSTITAVGLVGAWSCRQTLVTAASVSENAGARAGIFFGWNGTNVASGVWNFEIPAAPKIKFFKSSCILQDTNQAQDQTGINADTTNDVTGLTFVKFGAGTWDFNYELWGVPA